MKLNLRKLVLGAAIAILPQLMNAQDSGADFSSHDLGHGTQNGSFTAEYTMVANADGVDAALGFCYGDAAGFNDFGPIVRFTTAGVIDARNGGGYAAEAVINYVSGESFLVKMDVNVLAQTYTVKVTPASTSTEVTLATDYAFRTNQPLLNKYGLKAGTDTENHTITGFTSTPVTGTPIFEAIDAVSMTSGDSKDIDIVVTDPLGATITLSVGSSSTITASIATDVLTLSPAIDEYGMLSAIVNATSTSGSTDYTIPVKVRNSNGLFVIAENANHMITVGEKEVIEYFDNGVNGNIRNENSNFPMSDLDVWVSRKPAHFLGGLHQYVPAADNPDGEAVADYDGIAVYSLMLPQIPAGKTIADLEGVSFSFNLQTNTAWGVVSFDLYGLDARDAADVLGTDFYVGPSSAATSGALIQAGIFNQTTIAGTIATSDAANVALNVYIKAQYDAGNAGKYVFLRVNHDLAEITTYLRAQITTADQDPASVKLELNFGTDEGLSTAKVERQTLNIYPNPVTNGEFTVSTVGMKSAVEMTIFNVTGKLVSKQSLNAAGNKTTVNVNLTQGLYIVQLTDGVVIKTSKMSVK